MFERTIQEVRTYFTRIGLSDVFAGVRRISVVRTESYHDVRTQCIGLNPADLRRPFAAFHRGPYLLIHELGHHLAEVWMTRAERRELAPLFGDYDAPYRRAPKPRAADPDHVSRYSMVHPAEDFAETFAVCLWSDWDPAAVERLMRMKSPLCRRKIAAVRRLVRRKAKRGARPRGHGAAMRTPHGNPAMHVGKDCVAMGPLPRGPSDRARNSSPPSP